MTYRKMINPVKSSFKKLLDLKARGSDLTQEIQEKVICDKINEFSAKL